MKKVIFTMCLLAAAAFCQAQFSIGGSVGVGYDKTKPDTGSDLKTLQLNVSPNVNYMFDDKMGVGLELGFNYKKNNNGYSNPVIFYSNPLIVNGDDNFKTTGWLIAPYFRYVVCEFDNFNLYADLKVNVGNEKTKYGSNDINKVFSLGANVVPGVCYNINDHCSVHATLNVVALGYNYKKTTDQTLLGEPVTKNTNIGVNVNGNTPLNIGFFYTL